MIRYMDYFNNIIIIPVESAAILLSPRPNVI